MKDELILNNIKLVYFVITKMNLVDQKEYYYDIGLLGLVKAANAFDPSKGYKFDTLAIRCIQNQILMDMRVNKKYSNDISLNSLVSIDSENDIELIDVISSDFNLEDDLIAKEKIELLHKAIMKLKPDERKILKYYYKDRMKQYEIAEIFNIKHNAISHRLTRIIKKLRMMLDKKGE